MGQKVTPALGDAACGSLVSASDARNDVAPRTPRGCPTTASRGTRARTRGTRRRRTPAPSRRPARPCRRSCRARTRRAATAAPQRPAAGRVEPALHVGLGVEHDGSPDRACGRSRRSRGRSRRSTARAVPTCARTPRCPVCQFVLSACLASMRSVTFSPPPPTQISGSCWIGFGSQYAPSNVRCLPWNVTVSSVQSRFTTSSVSSRISSRTPARVRVCRRPGTHARTSRRRARG